MVRRLAPGTTRALLLAFAAIFAGACQRLRVESPLPATAHRFVAPAVYQQWWALTSECSGASGSLESVQWFVVPGVSLFWRDGSVVNGFWSRDGNKIVLAEGAIDDGEVVRHEMLHALQVDGRHTRRAFIERCGGVVSCMSACIDVASRSPQGGASLPRVPASSMVIDVAVDPGDPGSTSYDGHFAVTVSVRNPARDSVVVTLPGFEEGVRTPSFRYELSDGTEGVSYSLPAPDSGLMVFGPGETRRAVFDFKISSSFKGMRVLPPGSYSVRGGFGAQWSAPRSFVLAQ
jgi:hypothetical protein